VRRAAALSLACTAVLFLGTVDASAAVRFAAPGGSAPAASDCPRSNPCSLYNAADRLALNTNLKAGDEIAVEPGTYSSAAGDLGPEGGIIAAFNTNVHGMAGRPRPLVEVSSGGGAAAFRIEGPQAVLSDVEILAREESRGFSLFDGTVEGVVARADSQLETCRQQGGLVRDTVCLSTGAAGTALGTSLFGAPANQVHTLKLRNVTAIATGPGSVGISFLGSGPLELNGGAAGVLARGAAHDVLAESKSPDPHTPGSGAKLTLAFDHSDFADAQALTDGGGPVSVTAPGFGTNITGNPLLAGDGYHELAGSPTLDAGVADALSGATDVDGNLRRLGAGTDIGADELGDATATTLVCQPDSLVLGGGGTACTATVSSSAGSPTGSVALSGDGPGSFAAVGVCTLVPVGPGASSCGLPYTPSAVGSGTRQLSASYLGDATHELSAGSTAIRVGAPAPAPRLPVFPATAAPNTTLRKKPARRTASRRATFSFLASKAGSSFQCRLDHKPFKRCRSPFTIKRLSPGRHTFQVRAVDSAGVIDPTPAVYGWKVV
jgi:hypothetical protein